METKTDYQPLETAKKIKKTFGHINPEQPPEVCPIRDILSPVSDKWSLLIMIFLGGYQTLRFNEIKKKVYGISSKVLTQRLKTLEKDGYIKRKLYPQVPVKVEYTISEFGYRYLDKIIELTEWINSEIPEVLSNRTK